MWKIERIIVLFFALMLALNLTIAGSAAAETFYVDDDGTGDFTTIQAALSNASPEDEIVVRSGTYAENVDVDKADITIRSESGNPFDTIVKAYSSSDHVFNVTADGVKISGFSITGASDSSNGIYLVGVEYCLIENNTASNNDYGIYLDHSSSSILSGNRMQDNAYNFYAYGELDTNIVYTNNSVDGKPIYYLVEVSDLEINSSSNAGTVYLIDCKNITVKDLNIEKTGHGILLYNTTDSKLENNTASDNDYGIKLSHSSNNFIYNNYFTNNSFGIMLGNYYSNFIYNNYFNNTYNVRSDCVNLLNTPEEVWYTYDGNLHYGHLGNYFSDYSGSDTNGDGVGEEPYFIGIQDNYPLMLWPIEIRSPHVRNTDSGKEFPTIQTAIDDPDTQDGDTLVVEKGTYMENVDVTKNLSILSETGPDDTIVMALDPEDHVLKVTADGVKISGFSIKGATGTESIGIRLEGVEYCLIENNKVSNNCWGIRLFDSSNNTLKNNTANSNNDYGIYLDHSSSNTLSNNTASNNDYGIWLSSSSNYNTLSNNTASNNYYGIYIYDSSSSILSGNRMQDNAYNFYAYGELDTNIVYANNSVDGKQIYYLVEVSDLEINSSSNAGTVYLIDCKNITVKDLNIEKTGHGILLYNTTDSKLENNSALNNSCGIKMDFSSSNTLYNNTADSNTYYGIVLVASSGNSIYNNYFNNTNNAYFKGTNTGNIWNTTKITGSNIIGGPYLGGNFWATPTKDGFSQTHKDKDGDGICDVTYKLDEGNIDYLPLLIPSSPHSPPPSSPWKPLEYVTENFTISCKYFKPMCSNPPPDVIVNENISFEVSPPSDKIVYKNVTIQVGEANFSSNESNFRDATIEFRVEKSWIKENSTINLYRYLGEGKWKNLNPSKVSEDESFIYFKAETPAFSLFTICDKEELRRKVREVESEWKPLENDTENFTISLEYLDTGYSNPPGIIVNESASSEFSAPSDEIVYKNVNIQVGEANFSSNEDNFRNATIEFRVENSWIQENNINESTIVMRRFSEGKWENLNTSLLTTSKVSNATIEENNISEDKIHLERYSEGIWDYLKTPKVNDYDDYIYFVAETPGFSPFDIFGKVLPDGLPNEVRIFSAAYLLIICLGKFFVSREKDQDKK